MGDQRPGTGWLVCDKTTADSWGGEIARPSARPGASPIPSRTDGIASLAEQTESFHAAGRRMLSSS